MTRVCRFLSISGDCGYLQVQAPACCLEVPSKSRMSPDVNGYFLPRRKRVKFRAAFLLMEQ